MNTNIRLYFTLFILSLIAFSCDSDDETTPIVEIDRLVEGNVIFGRGVSELKSFIELSGNADLIEIGDLIDSDVTFYEVTYRTTYLGQEIIASGLVTFPETTEAVPMISFQNGTIASDAEAPTNNLSTFTVLSGIAGAGYILAIPDYIGFGESVEVIPPYHHAELAGRSVIDLMRATRELAFQEGYSFDGRAFLAGYSEGGYSTMAAHKLMEEENPEGFELVASAPSSGGYDVKGFQEWYFEQESYDNPFFMAFVALSYKTVYEYDEPLSDLFQDPYADRIPALFDGSKNGGQINAELNTVVAEFIQPDIRANIDSNPQYATFVDALNDNTITNWIPRAPMYMYHGTADVTVPYENSVDSYQQLLDAGASPDVVKFIDLPGETHGSGFAPYLLEAITLFETLK